MDTVPMGLQTAGRIVWIIPGSGLNPKAELKSE